MTVAEEFWGWLLRQLKCVVCSRFESTGEPPALHHIAEGSGVRSEYGRAPICFTHHQGPLGLHFMGSDAWIRMFRPPGDSEFGILVWVIEDVATYLRSWLKKTVGLRGIP